MSDSAHTEAGLPRGQGPSVQRERLDAEISQLGITAGDIVETIHEPLVVLTPGLRVRVVNPAFYEHFRVAAEETMDRLIYELGNGQWDIPELRTLLEDVLPHNKVFNDYEVRHEFEGLGERVMLLNARRLDHVQFILLGIRDITDKVAAEAALREWTETLEERVEERTREARQLAETLSLAEQEERQRISHLLHDDLQQLLYGIQMKISLALEQAETRDYEACTAHARRSLDLLDDAITRTRQLTVDLNPPILEGEGLVGALEWLRTQTRDLHGIAVEIRAPQEVEVHSPDIRILLFQVTRELLFNVAKHAETNRAVVEVGKEDGRARVSVTDEGKGFDPAPLAPARGRSGLGLFSARERLRMRGGDLEIHSIPGDGTRVVAYAPLAAAPESAVGS